MNDESHPEEPEMLSPANITWFVPYGRTTSPQVLDHDEYTVPVPPHVRSRSPSLAEADTAVPNTDNITNEHAQNFFMSTFSRT
jgi:hypothetical protein